jgi:hypothetical protein
MDRLSMSALLPVQPGADRVMAQVAARSRPLVLSGAQVIEVPEVLARVLPDRGLRRGTTLSVGTASVSGATALALALLSGASRSGSWCAAVGVPELGLVAASEVGIRLDHLALVPDPGAHWARVTAALLDGVELLLIRPPTNLRAGDARRLIARARERRAVLVVLGHDRWPERADIRLTVVAASWQGLGEGHGFLRSREVEVAVTGRRGAARERRCRLLLPNPDGAVVPADGGDITADGADVVAGVDRDASVRAVS